MVLDQMNESLPTIHPQVRAALVLIMEDSYLKVWMVLDQMNESLPAIHPQVWAALVLMMEDTVSAN